MDLLLEMLMGRFFQDLLVIEFLAGINWAVLVVTGPANLLLAVFQTGGLDFFPGKIVLFIPFLHLHVAPPRSVAGLTPHPGKFSGPPFVVGQKTAFCKAGGMTFEAIIVFSVILAGIQLGFDFFFSKIVGFQAIHRLGVGGLQP